MKFLCSTVGYGREVNKCIHSITGVTRYFDSFSVVFFVVIVAFCFVLWGVSCFVLVEIGSHCIAQADPEFLRIFLTQPSGHLILLYALRILFL